MAGNARKIETPPTLSASVCYELGQLSRVDNEAALTEAEAVWFAAGTALVKLSGSTKRLNDCMASIADVFALTGIVPAAKPPFLN